MELGLAAWYIWPQSTPQPSLHSAFMGNREGHSSGKTQSCSARDSWLCKQCVFYSQGQVRTPLLHSQKQPWARQRSPVLTKVFVLLLLGPYYSVPEPLGGATWPAPCTSGASQVELVVKNLPASAGDVRNVGSIPGSGRSPGEAYGSPLQYSCLENPMDRGSWQASVDRITQSQTQLKRLSTYAPYTSLPGLTCKQPPTLSPPPPGWTEHLEDEGRMESQTERSLESLNDSVELSPFHLPQISLDCDMNKK